MQLLDAELASLQSSGVMATALAGWVRGEQQRKRDAEAKFDDAAGAAGLFGGGSSSEEEEFEDDSEDDNRSGADLPTASWSDPGASVEVWYALARGAAFGHGDEVWAAAIYLSEQLCHAEGRAALLPPPRAGGGGGALSGYRMLEVGAGCAIPSWVCTQLGASVACSDYPSLPSITAMLRAALLNGRGAGALGAAAGITPERSHAGRVEVVGHAWGADVAPLLGALGADDSPERYDVAIVCDCIYDPSGHDPLLHTLCDTLRPGGVALVAFSLHGNVEDEAIWQFFKRAEECGLGVEHTAEEDMHPDLVGKLGAALEQVELDGDETAGTVQRSTGRQCLSKRRGAKRNKVYMTKMLAPAESVALFKDAVVATPIPVPGPAAASTASVPAGRATCELESVGCMQHGVGLIATDCTPGSDEEDDDGPELMASVVVKQVPGRGRCVFAGASPIKRGELIEIAPCLRFPHAQYEAMKLSQTPLEHYVFVERGTRDLLLALGIGSLFNHSDNPNVDYRVAPPFTGEDPNADPQGRVVYRCSRPIAPGEELCIYYGPDLWFKENQAVE